ncbi:MAG TPA: sensor histidine kinase [Longimicrobiales bacterium]|nr:sensor histidine kinase [Longimicrobiales bacterium]
MRLSEFIDQDREPIMVEWETFARRLGAITETMDIAALRDHASEMLTVIAADLETPQTEREQRRKSRGLAPDEAGDPPTAAESHGADRAERGFSIEEMVSEYRALRATVIRLWMDTCETIGETEVLDMVRFNEAIDQALAESVVRYTADLDESREMFIAILSHDLRTPLGAIITASTFMLETDELEEPQLTLTSRIASSSRRMERMIGNLLDLTRSRLGGGIPIERGPMSMETVVQDVVAELAAVHPARAVEVDMKGDLGGSWDEGRLTQVMANLVGNALDHGDPEKPVSVTLSGRKEDVTIAVQNHGLPIVPSMMSRIFNPMKRRQGRDGRPADTTHLGLGLYIAERIMSAHGGTIDVASSASEGTTFTIHLPRDASLPGR